MSNKKILKTKKTKRVSILVGLVIFLFLGVLLYVNASSLSTFFFGGSVKGASSMNPKRSIEIGQQAITPKTDPSTTKGSTFTLDDAKAYIVAHPFHNGITTTGQPSSIDSMYFTTDKQVKDLTKSEAGLSPDAPELVVIEKGPFLLDNAFGPPGGAIPTVKKVIEVFDAHTGNQLMWGGWD